MNNKNPFSRQLLNRENNEMTPNASKVIDERHKINSQSGVSDFQKGASLAFFLPVIGLIISLFSNEPDFKKGAISMFIFQVVSATIIYLIFFL